MMDTAIRLENIIKIFKNKQNKKQPEESKEIIALGGVSLEVKKGEIFGLLGPNGAGKTTAIRCIAGILQLNSGKIYIKNQELNRSSAHICRRDLGFLTENHGNYENLTLHDNLKFFGSFYALNNLEERIDDTLKQIGLFERKDMKAGKLSKGQKQRLAIARTILHNPEILFFDEPTAGLDPAASVHVRNLILGLKRDDRTIFINSHNLEEVQKICDRVAILDLGKIRRIGEPSELGKDLWDAQELRCSLKDPISSKIVSTLSKLDYIKKYRIEDKSIIIYSDNIDETTPRIIKELVRLDANILEIKRTVHSLEEIYLRLMNEKHGDQNGFKK